MIVFISCVKTKLNQKSTAEKLYQSPLFKKQLMYAKQITDQSDDIYILSAKHGVLELHDVIHPYELTLNNMNKAEQKKWVTKCYLQLKRKKINFNDEVVFFAGVNYNKY